MKNLLLSIWGFAMSAVAMSACAQNISRPIVRVPNSGFEAFGESRQPDFWYVGSGGIETGHTFRGGIDSTTYHGGHYSAEIHANGTPAEGEFGVVGTYSIPVTSVVGKRLKIGAWIKACDVSNEVHLWVNVQGQNNTWLGGSGIQDSVKGTHDWKYYWFDLPIDSSATIINLGGVLNGRGEAWFDDFSVGVEQ